MGGLVPGPSATRRPVYVDLLPPCNNACPAGENIQGWLATPESGKHEEAWRQSWSPTTRSPAIHGRVCYHPCESSAIAPISTARSRSTRSSGSSATLAREHGWHSSRPPQPSGKRVLVVGAGPSGLSAAYHLARLGHQVEIRDAGAEPGGMMRYGIPNYRLPRDVLDDEIERIAALGVRITCGHRVEDLAAERRTGDFDAVVRRGRRPPGQACQHPGPGRGPR